MQPLQTKDAFTFNWYAVMSDKFYKSNQCQDHDIKLCGSKCNDNYWYKVRSHKQSPIQVQYDPRVDACEDRHEFQTPVVRKHTHKYSFWISGH